MTVPTLQVFDATKVEELYVALARRSCARCLHWRVDHCLGEPYDCHMTPCDCPGFLQDAGLTPLP